MSFDRLDPSTPVIIGVGQVSERVTDEDYAGRSAADLAGAAAAAAVLDSGAHGLVEHIDTVATTRQFDSSVPGAQAPLGRSTSFPRSVAERLGADPVRAVLEVSGGQSPQHLVTEFAREITQGRSSVVLLAGGEAISTARHLAKGDVKPDFSESPGGVTEDRGFGLRGLASREQFIHGLDDAPSQYALLENARRAARGESRATYAEGMGRLFAPFTRVAAQNPHAASRAVHSAEELVTVDENNRMIADPYPRRLVARDQVNQAAAVILASVRVARELGVPEDRWVFLQGQADLREQPLMERGELAVAPSAPRAVELALDAAGLSIDEIEFLDLYSCFPIAVSNVADVLGLAPEDPRGLTLTGGLPYFGGAGNNYSMHAIAEAVDAVRAKPGSFALVGANGGVLSKYSVGIYGTRPTAIRADASTQMQAAIDALPVPRHEPTPDGWATIETYTVKYGRKGRTGVLIGRLESDGSRFIAMTHPGDDAMLAVLESEQPVGERIFVRAFGFGNRASVSPEVLDTLLPPRVPRLREDFEFITVSRDGHVLEVVLNRPDSRNALHPPAHEELEEVFDAFEADPDLWVAVISGAGHSFCAGNDLMYGATGKQVYVPRSGFGGLTSRRLTKPVVAAVHGYALGGGFEIALACHLVVADETARFALSEVKVGLIAGAGGLIRLPRKIPPNVANELVLTGRRIDADEARSLGIVNRVAPSGGALEAARELAAEIVAGSPTSVRLSLALMAEVAGTADELEAVTHPSDVIDELLFSEDMIEGMTAFATKRPPVWHNR